MKAMVLVVTLALLAGCVSRAPSYGNFSPELNQYGQAGIAYDAMLTLVRLYPPAQTRIEVRQVIGDDYGRQLIKELRRVGYAVREFDPENTDISSAPMGHHSLALNYVVDEPGDGLTRITLLLGNHRLTRGYRVTRGLYVPAGEWAYKGRDQT